MRLSNASIGLGLIGALALARFMKDLLFGATPTDVSTLLGVAAA
jgi:hypothetical protein